MNLSMNPEWGELPSSPTVVAVSTVRELGSSRHSLPVHDPDARPEWRSELPINQ